MELVGGNVLDLLVRFELLNAYRGLGSLPGLVIVPDEQSFWLEENTGEKKSPR
jgi:hypothetical protein